MNSTSLLSALLAILLFTCSISDAASHVSTVDSPTSSGAPSSSSDPSSGNDSQGGNVRSDGIQQGNANELPLWNRPCISLFGNNYCNKGVPVSPRSSCCSSSFGYPFRGSYLQGGYPKSGGIIQGDTNGTPELLGSYMSSTPLNLRIYCTICICCYLISVELSTPGLNCTRRYYNNPIPW